MKSPGTRFLGDAIFHFLSVSGKFWPHPGAFVPKTVFARRPLLGPITAFERGRNPSCSGRGDGRVVPRQASQGGGEVRQKRVGRSPRNRKINEISWNSFLPAVCFSLFIGLCRNLPTPGRLCSRNDFCETPSSRQLHRLREDATHPVAGRATEGPSPVRPVRGEGEVRKTRVGRSPRNQKINEISWNSFLRDVPSWGMFCIGLSRNLSTPGRLCSRNDFCATPSPGPLSAFERGRNPSCSGWGDGRALPRKASQTRCVVSVQVLF